jgi:hypothetical protein
MYKDPERTHTAKTVGVTGPDPDATGEPAAPDAPFIAKPTRVKFGGADQAPTEWGFVAEQGDHVAPADLPQQDAHQDPQEYIGYLMPPQQPPSPSWEHVPSRGDPDHNADTTSPSGTQPPDTAPYAELRACAGTPADSPDRDQAPLLTTATSLVTPGTLRSWR